MCSRVSGKKLHSSAINVAYGNYRVAVGRHMGHGISPPNINPRGDPAPLRGHRSRVEFRPDV